MSGYQEVIVDSIGEFGRSQVIIMLGCTAPKFIMAWSMVMMGFAGAQPDWWITVTKYNQTSNSSTTTRKMKECPQSSNDTIHFETNIFTIVSEWHLVCDREWIPTAIATTQMVGVLVGAAVMGQLGDWFGRKKTIITVYAADLLFVMILGFSVNWYMMSACAFFLGFSIGGFLVLCNVYMLEFIGTKWRSFAGLMPFWGLGLLLFGATFKIFPNWRHLCFATTVVGSPLLVLLWFTPRSIRWLLTHGKYEEGKTVLHAIAKTNKLSPPNLSHLERLIEVLEDEKKEKKFTYLSLFKYTSTRGKTLILAVIWFTCSFAYYGLTLGVSRLSGDIAVNMALMGLGEAVCMAMVWLLSKCFGRKYTTLILFFFTGISSLGITIAYFHSDNFKLIKNVLALISRFFLSAAWASVILMTVETYPTVIRSAGYGFASVIARIGGIIAPQNKTFSSIASHLPFTVNGVLAMIACFMCILLSDTYTTDMEDHIEEEKNPLKGAERLEDERLEL